MMCKMNHSLLYFSLAIAMSACQSPAREETEKTLFTLLTPSQTQVEFTNALHYDEDFNIYTYRNFYNGGGVALGDVNNDGWIDIYLTANTESNKLYLNKGRLEGESTFQFEDVTEKAGVGGKR